MSRTQALLLVLACLLAAAWAARRAAPSLFADVGPSAAADAPAVPWSSHGILAQAERLRARLNSPRPFRPPSRNPFRFSEAPSPAGHPAGARAKGAGAPTTSLVERADRPEMQLVGVAEDPGPDGRLVRTAIVSAMTRLLFAKEGERVLGYEVVRITADAVQLKGQDGETFTLALK